MQAAKAVGILTLVGLVDIPIIHYSVNWWKTLHQQATILAFQKPTISADMLYPLLAMLAAFFLFYMIVVLLRSQNELLLREKDAAWVRDKKESKRLLTPDDSITDTSL